MKIVQGDQKFLIRADFYGDIASNVKKGFWLPVSKGVMYFANDKINYRQFAEGETKLELDFGKIIKVKMQTLNPWKHQWTRSVLGNPFIFMFWNPFWNRYQINITYLDESGQPREVFFKLKTKKVTLETLDLLKKMLSDSIVRVPGEPD